MIAIDTPYPVFSDLDGKPLDNGYLYFGERDKNPETFPVTVYWDAAATQPALQPIRTLNGYAVRNGTPAAVYVASDYSLTVRNKKRELVFYSASTARFATPIVDEFVGDGVTASFTLSSPAFSADALEVVIDGLVLSPEDYDVNGATLTLMQAPLDGQELLVRFSLALPVGGVNAANVIFTAAGGVPRALDIKLADFGISVIDMGADPTGVADSTAAFNAAADALRAKLATLGGLTFIYAKILVPPGRYSICSWNLTSLLARRVEVHMHGAILIANTPGKHVIDGIGSRWLDIHGGVIHSPLAVEAKSGLQIGNKGTETCGNNAFHDLTIAGYFSHAALMNLGSETTCHYGCIYLQQKVGASVYAEICDGLGNAAFLPTSDYATITKTAGTAVSFTRNAYYSTQIRNEGGGSAHYVSAPANGWLYDEGCYHLSFNDSAFVLFATNTQRISDITLGGLFENSQNDNPTPGNIGLRYMVTLDNDGTPTAIDGFRLICGIPQCETFAVRNIGAASCRLTNALISIQDFFIPTALFFGGSGALSVDGVIETADASQLNLASLTSFDGEVRANTYGSLASLPPAGAYEVRSRTDATTYHAGAQAFPSAPVTFTPTITFATPGDLSVSYATQLGWAFKVGKMVFFNIALTFTPTHTTASGEFRIAGLPYGASAEANRSAAISVANINSAWAWPASTTQVVGVLPNNSTNIRLWAHGSGVASAQFTAANVPSGTAKTLVLSGSFISQ
jgi:hypothetical protein